MRAFIAFAVFIAGIATEQNIFTRIKDRYYKDNIVILSTNSANTTRRLFYSDYSTYGIAKNKFLEKVFSFILTDKNVDEIILNPLDFDFKTERFINSRTNILLTTKFDDKNWLLSVFHKFWYNRRYDISYLKTL